jgi:hypothetical protein
MFIMFYENRQWHNDNRLPDSDIITLSCNPINIRLTLIDGMQCPENMLHTTLENQRYFDAAAKVRKYF